MFKNLIQQVTKRENKQIDQPQFPTFEDLAPRQFKKLSQDEIWKHELTDLFEYMKKQEIYIEQIKSAYEDIVLQLSPFFNKYNKLEQERKSLLQQQQLTEGKIVDLEYTIIDLKEKLGNEPSQNYMRGFQQGPKKQQQIQQQDFSSQVEIQQTCTCQNEIQELIKSHWNQIKQMQTKSENDISQLKKKCRDMESNQTQLLQQIVELSSKNRNEIASIEKENENLITQLEKQKNLLETERLKQTQSIQLTIQMESLQYKIEELKIMNSNLKGENENLKLQLEQSNEQIQKINKIIETMQQKREAALDEIKNLSNRFEVSTPQSNLSLDNIKRIKFGLQNCLVQQKKKFQETHKKFMIESLSIKEKFGLKPTQSLLNLDQDFNQMIINFQDLLDEIDDVIQI